MSSLILAIGNKNYSSWSMRPWLVLSHFGIPFEEHYIPLYTEGSRQQLEQWSPSGKVPALHDGELVVWDSLAICEYLAELHPELPLWPSDSAARAVARSVSAEMHSGFADLRRSMPMNCRASFPGKGQTPEALQDIARIVAIWNDCRHRFGQKGAFLFGEFTIADAMYVPIALRFTIYDMPLEGEARKYADALLSLPAVKQWLADVEQEQEIIPAFEIYD